MTNPLVSVIIPAYNAQDFVAQTIESVIKQTYSHWELCIVDDGSTDDTAKITQSYSSDSRIKYLYQKNQERAVARNHGLHHSTGKYIAFLDADDMWLPDKLETQVQFLENQPESALCFTQFLFINEQGIVTGKAGIPFKSGSDQFFRLLEGNFIANSTVMVPRIVFDKVGFFDETLPAFGSEDWDMWLRIARNYPIRFVHKPLTLYRIHGYNTSLDRMCLSAEAVLQKLFSDPTFPAGIVRNKKRIYAHIYLGFSETYLKLNQKKRAVEYWWRALRLYPKMMWQTQRGLWATLKLILPNAVVANLSKLRLKLQRQKTSIPTEFGV